MEKLLPIFRAFPIPLFLYGIVSTVIEFLNIHVTVDQITFGAATSLAERVMYWRAYVFSLDNFFFYTGLAALVAVAVRYERQV